MGLICGEPENSGGVSPVLLTYCEVQNSTLTRGPLEKKPTRLRATQSACVCGRGRLREKEWTIYMYIKRERERERERAVFDIAFCDGGTNWSQTD